ncbi:hypothetical protein [Verminephrobacter eiseniae]|uniref:hypothetical protein n=1 Tax=Verminephrobacter eiseniae TaxID=364317 RepID=UPI002237B9AC|nr:hypothetical protein [Verminephrobacter eiseniae]MCW5237175.1 hypothetical protein [Verminephrobacter eiseniae]
MESLSSALPDMVDAVCEFWSSVGDAAGYHLQDSRQLKAVFAGDIFPARWENAVSTAGLYIDTIILPCPITRLGTLLKAEPSTQIIKAIIKHVLTAMTYRDIALGGCAAERFQDGFALLEDATSRLREDFRRLTCC